MKIHSGIKPYNEIWLYCSLNDAMSVLVSKNSTYELFALMNYMHYNIKGTDSWWRDLEIDKNREFLNKIWRYIFIQDMQVKPEEVCNTLKEYIAKGEIVYVLVDVFYWLKERIDYHNHHTEHYFIVSGYDDEKKCFYVLSDANKGYGEYEISYDDFFLALAKESNKPLLRIIKLANQTQDFEFDIKDSIKFAKTLAFETAAMSYTTYWVGANDGDRSSYYNMLTKFYEKAKANKKLFSYIYNNGYISQKCYDTLINSIDKIVNGWDVIRSSFFRSILKKKDVDIDKLNFEARKLFIEEAGMWNVYIIELENSEKIRSDKL